MTVQRYDNQGLPAYPSDGDDTFVRSADYDGMESAWRNACERGDKAVTENAALRAGLAFARSTGDESALEYHALKARLAEAADWIATAHQTDCSIFWRNSTACDRGRDALYRSLCGSATL